MASVSAFNPVNLGYVLGSFLGVLLILSLAKFIVAKVTGKAVRGGAALYVSYVLSMCLVTVLSGYGRADGGDPQWAAAFFSYVPAHLVWFVYDQLKARRFGDGKSPEIFSKEALKRFACFWAVAIPVGALATFFVYGTGLTEDEDMTLRAGELDRTIQALNTNMPMKVNDDTTITGLSLEGDKTVVYHFQLSDAAYSSPDVKENIETDGYAGMVQYFCLDGAPELKQNGITAIRRYTNKAGDILTQSVLDTQKCAKEVLGLFAGELQKHLPIQQDKVTTLTGVKVQGDRSMVYDYTVSSDFYNSPGVKENIAANVPVKMKELLCSDDAKDFQSINAKVIYRYVDEADTPLSEFTFDTSDCGH